MLVCACGGICVCAKLYLLLEMVSNLQGVGVAGNKFHRGELPKNSGVKEWLKMGRMLPHPVYMSISYCFISILITHH